MKPEFEEFTNWLKTNKILSKEFTDEISVRVFALMQDAFKRGEENFKKEFIKKVEQSWKLKI